jgi:hypothetical protein
VETKDSRETTVRASEVQPGDYLAGLGRVQSFNDSGGPVSRRRITLFSEGNDWKVTLNPRHEVVVIR